MRNLPVESLDMPPNDESGWVTSHKSRLAVEFRSAGSGELHVVTPTPMQWTDNRLRKWSDSLHRLIGELERLPSLTESKFLRVGAKLQDLSARLHEIGEKAASAAQTMSGEEVLSIIEGLRNTLDRMERHLIDANHKAVRAVACLGDVRHELAGIQRLMSGFKERVGTLRMLKTLTNVQCASVGNGANGFQQVAADIGKLSQNIQAKSTDIIQKTASLNSELDKALQMITGLEAKRKNLAQVVVTNIRHGIEALAGMHDNCSGAAFSISSRTGEISREISEVVVAMQFHDITCQQMQHARESLDDLFASLRKECGKGTAGIDADSAGRDAMAANVAAVCELQLAQLANTADELISAVNRITESLRDVSRKAAYASGSAHEMFGFAKKIGQSSISEIEQGLSSVLMAFSENMATNLELKRIIVSVTTAVGEISLFLEDIEYIGSEIKLIAFNAIVKAIQAGRDGAAMSVIAETVKGQSEDICFQAGVISRTILKITSHLDEILEEIGSGDTTVASEVELEAMRNDLEPCLHSLKGANETVMALLTGTDRAAGTLAADIEDAINGINVHETVSILKNEVIARLDALTLSVRTLKQSGADSGKREGLAAMERRYTMRSERNVHRTFLSLTGGLQSPPPAAGLIGLIPPRGEDEFGDNVEFF